MNKSMKIRKRMLDGNAAAAEAMKLGRVSVIAAYPITPQSPLVEKLSRMAETKEIDCKFVCLESEHSALSYIIGAQLTGVRTGTATSSVGLALMHEIMGVASGCRIPIVMPIVNRALVSPWSLWCDHQDTMAERDSGWLQLYAENAQEVLDLILMSYKIAENERVLLPTMVCMDGFFVSHSLQPVIVPDQTTVDAFLHVYSPKNAYLDTQRPIFINNLTPSEEFTEMRYQQEIAHQEALELIPAVLEEYGETTGRKYSMVETYQCEDADAVIVSLGSSCGTVKHVVDQLRHQGRRVGSVKITSFRPFPVDMLKKAIAGVDRIGVLDRSAGLGAEVGPLCLEVQRSVRNGNCKVYNFIAGLGGRDIPERTVEQIFSGLLEDTFPQAKNWIDVRPDAMSIRTRM